MECKIRYVTFVSNFYNIFNWHLFKKASGGVHKNFVLWIGVTANVLLLIVFKYIDFLIENLNHVLSLVRLNEISYLDIVLPVGISFYIFQAIGYMIDVYRDNIKAEINFFDFALFLSFFPQLVAGPIERSQNLLRQIKNIGQINLYSIKNISYGIALMLWGYFQKLVIADRCAILVDDVYAHYQDVGGLNILIATMFFAIQIYCDFDGYTNIARGVAKILGFELIKNFEQPYLARNIEDFWKRWHISLTKWFTDYIYITLGGNKYGIKRTYVNIIIIFLLSGLWHGASWHFVVWGLIHAVLLILCKYSKKYINYEKVNRGISIIINFILVDIAWIFFRADSVETAILMFFRIINLKWIYSEFVFPFTMYDWIILSIGLLCLVVVDVLHEKKISIFSCLEHFPVLIRITTYILFTFSIILFGIYGSKYDVTSFIYFQF